MSKQIKKCAYYDYMLCKTFLHTLVFKVVSSPLFLTYCRIDIFRVLRQSFCGKFQIVCGFWNPANPVFRMYALSQICSNNDNQAKEESKLHKFIRIVTTRDLIHPQACTRKHLSDARPKRQIPPPTPQSPF